MPILAAAAALVLLSGSAGLAHHSYGDFVREQNVAVHGTVQYVLFANPHVTFRLRTDEGVTYDVEWANLVQLERQGIRSGMLKLADRITASGSPHRDPAIKKITLLTEVRPQSGEWRWTNARATPPAR
jgi:hypothetical protein